MAITLRTRPHLLFRFTLTVSGTTTQLTRSLQTNADGLVVWYVRLTSGPHRGAADSLPAQCAVRALDPGITGSATATFKIYPPLNPTVHAQLLRVQGLSVVQVDLQLATQARVSVLVSSPAAQAGPLMAARTTDGKRPLQIRVPLAVSTGPGVVHVVISIITAAGVTDTQVATLALPA